MRTYPPCIPCFFKQVIQTANFIGVDEKTLREMLTGLGERLSRIDWQKSPAENAQIVYELLSEVTGVEDPYRKLKEQSILTALKVYPELKKIVASSKDPLLAALKVAAAGNAIDFGVPGGFDIHEEVAHIRERTFAISAYDEFRKRLRDAPWVLILGDNAGETVFDRVLIETLDVDVVYAVRSTPVINDVTRKEALASGIGEVARIVETGMGIPSTVPQMVSPEFSRILYDAPLIISKGQGNFEGMEGSGLPVFFLLKAKCEVVAGVLGVSIGELVFKGEVNGW